MNVLKKIYVYFETKQNRLHKKLKIFILGRRPFNTIFSFNYHNIHHIVCFKKKFIHEYLTSKKYTFLDVGAGYSPYYELFEPYSNEYIVVDLEVSLPKNEKRNISQKIGFAESLPIQDNSIDIVISNQVLEHVNNDLESVKESYRVLKPNGFFIGSVPHISPIHLEPYDYRRYTELGLRKILEDSDFKIVKIEGNGGVHRAFAVTVMMDWYLSEFKLDENQYFREKLHFRLFLLNGFINSMAILMDFLIKSRKRSPSNYSWIAIKNS
ncbi:MAG: methyltransferase domain-containing protein [Bacteroidales bacterium]|nr:methyltransferase domain-containing protein [Bacteroidales bacterium]